MAPVHPLLDQTRDLLATPLAGCSAEQVARHPGDDPARWSAQQVVEHLSATWRMTTSGIEDRMQKGRPLRTRPTLAQHCMQFTVCELGFFPLRRPAPALVQPPATPLEQLSGDELITRFSETLAAMDRMLSEIEPHSKHTPVLTHFVLGPLNVHRWRSFHRTHARHHVAQIERAIHGT